MEGISEGHGSDVFRKCVCACVEERGREEASNSGETIMSQSVLLRLFFGGN